MAGPVAIYVWMVPAPARCHARSVVPVSAQTTIPASLGIWPLSWVEREACKRIRWIDYVGWYIGMVSSLESKQAIHLPKWEALGWRLRGAKHLHAVLVILVVLQSCKYAAGGCSCDTTPRCDRVSTLAWHAISPGLTDLTDLTDLTGRAGSKTSKASKHFAVANNCISSSSSSLVPSRPPSLAMLFWPSSSGAAANGWDGPLDVHT